jgi:hypothetical protein
MFAIWQGTVAAETVKEPVEIGIRVSGRNGGDYKVSVTDQGMTYEPSDLDGLTVLEFDAGSLVLTAFGRGNFGTLRGDRQVAERFLNSFFRI